jgi:hypothetical protein
MPPSLYQIEDRQYEVPDTWYRQVLECTSRLQSSICSQPDDRAVTEGSGSAFRLSHSAPSEHSREEPHDLRSLWLLSFDSPPRRARNTMEASTSHLPAKAGISAPDRDWNRRDVVIFVVGGKLDADAHTYSTAGTKIA